jgi:hypothetical protein
VVRRKSNAACSASATYSDVSIGQITGPKIDEQSLAKYSFSLNVRRISADKVFQELFAKDV